MTPRKHVEILYEVGWHNAEFWRNLQGSSRLSVALTGPDIPTFRLQDLANYSMPRYIQVCIPDIPLLEWIIETCSDLGTTTPKFRDRAHLGEPAGRQRSVVHTSLRTNATIE